MSTELRILTKKKFTGSNLTEVLHPLTNNANPASLALSQDARNEAITNGDFGLLVDTGAKNTIQAKIDSDLKNAAAIYSAFSVTQGDTEALTLAINNYTLGTTSRDDYQILNDSVKNAVDLIKARGMDGTEVAATYNRTGGTYSVTTERIADSLNVEYTDSTTDDQLAADIAAAVNPAP